MERAKLTIAGRVQGVWFRASTREAASDLGLVGTVRNLADGGVEAVAEGPREQIDELIAWCRQGPPLARVASVQVEWGTATGEFGSFEVAY